MNIHTSRSPASELLVQKGPSGEPSLARIYEKIEEKVHKLVIMLGDREYTHTNWWYGENVKQVLVELAKDEYDLHCCVTCSNFGMTGFVAESSGGSTGYCWLTTGKEAIDSKFLSHVLHWCKDWSPGDYSLSYSEEWHSYPIGSEYSQRVLEPIYLPVLESLNRLGGSGTLEQIMKGMLSGNFTRVRRGNREDTQWLPSLKYPIYEWLIILAAQHLQERGLLRKNSKDFLELTTEGTELVVSWGGSE